MIAHGIPLPGTAPRPEDQWLYDNPMATVSVIGSPGFGQRLHVSISDAPVQPAEVFPPGFGVPDSPTAEQPVISVVDRTKHFMVSQDNHNHNNISQPYLSPPADFNGSDRLGSSLSPQPIHGFSHPYGLDATQVGVDFVLLYVVFPSLFFKKKKNFIQFFQSSKSQLRSTVYLANHQFPNFAAWNAVAYTMRTNLTT